MQRSRGRQEKREGAQLGSTGVTEKVATSGSGEGDKAAKKLRDEDEVLMEGMTRTDSDLGARLRF